MDESTFDKSFTIHIPKILFGILFVFFCVFIFLYLNNYNDQLYGTILAGISTGIFVALVQFVMGWYEHDKIKRLHQKILRFESMEIHDILPHRDDEAAYRERIKNVKEKLHVLGHTASRFVEDFANEDNPRDDKKVLFNILANSRSVKILIANKSHLTRTKHAQFDATLSKLKKIRQTYSNLEVKYYNHTPAHNIFQFDNECLLGPIFPSVESQDTPTLHTTASSAYAKFYMKYFDDEWNQATSIDDIPEPAHP